MVIDVMKGYGIDGRVAQERLEAVGLITNMQLIPDDRQPASRPSGLRIGTPAVTARGMGESEMEVIGEEIDRAIRRIAPQKVPASLLELAKRFTSFDLR